MVKIRRTALVSLAGLLLALPLCAQPNAYDLFRQVRQAYSGLTSYRDHGEIEIVTADRKVERMARYEIELAASAEGGFRFLLQPQGHPEAAKVLWREGKEAFAYDAGLGQVRPVASLLAETLESLGDVGGADGMGYDALVVPALLAGGADVLSDPEVAKVEGSGPCGSESCWQLLISRSGGVEARLWIDQETSTIRRVEVRLPGRSGRRATLRVTHEIDAVDRPLTAADLTFVPPSGTRRVETWERERPGGEPGDVFGGEVTVALSTMVTRVVHLDGSPVLGLKPEDFRVRVGKMEIPVVAVDWVSSQAPEGSEDAKDANGDRQQAGEQGSGVAPGKQVVFFVQADLEPVRITGQLGLLPLARDLLRSLGPQDQVAVVSFDSHLKLWLDWTQDEEEILATLAEAVRYGGGRTVARSDDPASLTRYFDTGAAKRAANAARALELTARSLVPFPGEKVVVYVGWGFRMWKGAGTTIELLPALEALREAQGTVFALDITQAGHTLAGGLKLMAEASGGAYSSTAVFPQQAINKLARAISGHYVLTVDRSELPARGGDLRIDLRKKMDVRILYRSGSLDR